MQKTKKNLNFCLFAEGNDQDPRQRRVLCRGPSNCPRQRFFLKKIKFLQHFFAEGHGWRPSAKIFQKKRIILCRGPSHCPRQRFFEKICTFLCRGPCLEALGKDFSKIKNSLPRAAGDGPRQRLRPRRRRRDGCFSLPSAAPALGKGFTKFLIKGPRQRPSSSTQNFPRALCRGPPLAKPLARA